MQRCLGAMEILLENRQGPSFHSAEGHDTRQMSGVSPKQKEHVQQKGMPNSPILILPLNIENFH